VTESFHNQLRNPGSIVWLLTQPSLINARKRSLLPMVKERQALADGLAKYLAQLGLKRVAKDLSLHEYIKTKYGNRPISRVHMETFRNQQLQLAANASYFRKATNGQSVGHSA
jgi:hypothetical protein